MPFWDAANNRVHTDGTLTDAFIAQARIPRQMEALIQVESQGVSSEAVNIDRKQGQLGIIDPRARGEEPSRTEIPDYKQVSLPIPHYPDMIRVEADEVVGRREFGSETAYELPENRLAEKMQAQNESYEVTYELSNVAACRGLVTNSKGDVVVDVKAQFQQGPTGLTMNLTDADTDYHAVFRCHKRKLRAQVGALAVTGYVAFTPPAMFEKIVRSKNLKESYARWQDGAFLRGDHRTGFTVAENVQIVEYESLDVGSDIALFPDDEIIMVPIARGLFKRKFAPKRGMTTVNRPGRPKYVSTKILDHDAGFELKVETNFITFNSRPESVGIITQGANPQV